MEKEKIVSEIKKLEGIKYKWSTTRMSKFEASSLISEIEMFNHTFSINFPNSENHYRKNQHAEIQITDGISDLEHYSKSKLKQKDDHYFYDAIKKLKRGINHIILKLETELER